MLTLTDNAVSVIRTIVSQPEVPDGAGLRIAAENTNTAEGLTLSLATAPQEGDQVVDTSGARLFLEPTAASVLDDKALDADVDEQGKVSFALAEQ
ncbi:MAG: Fe-S cluster assembly protein HesB [Micromonosporaceae bacterium]|nr:Fe-S cluster assembly protein HesB [Micromonosporaceae bacterium]